MKIREVCRLTGLTERTIRFYEEEGLIQPASYTLNGRDYREYTQRDAEELRIYAGLRRAEFSLAEIRRMKETPDEIPAIVHEVRERLRQAGKNQRRTLQALDALEDADLWSVRALAGRLASAANRLPLPEQDVAPCFDRLEDTPPDERAAAYRRYQKDQEKRFRRGRGIVVGIGVLSLIGAAAGLLAEPNLLAFALNVLAAIGLLAGYSWVRYLTAVLFTLEGLGLIAVLFFVEIPPDLLFLLIPYFLLVAYYLTAACLLFFSKAVEEYLYARRHP